MAELVNILDQDKAPSAEETAVVVGTEQAPEQSPDTAGNEGDSEQKTYAGKYKSVEDLEKGYQELQSQQGKAGQQMGELKSQLEQQTQVLTEQQQQMAALLEQSQKPAEPAVNYDGARAKIARQMDDGDMSFAEGMQAIRGVDAEELSTRAEQDKQAILQQTQQQFQQELAARDEQQMVEQFHSDNPDFSGLQESGVLENVKAQSKYINDDYQAYLAYKAEKAFEEGKNAAVKEVAGSEPAASVAASPGTAMKTETPAAPTRSATPAELLQSGLDAWANAGGNR